MASPPLEISLPSWEQIAAFFAHDIETMRLFVPTAYPPEVGSLLVVNLKGPSGTPLPMRVKVVDHVFGERIGANVGFDPLTNEDRQGLADWLVEEQQASLAMAAAAAAAQPPQPPEPIAAPAPPPAPTGPRAPALKSALEAPAEHVTQMEQALSQQLARFKKLDGYTILGLDSTAGGAEVKAAYSKLVQSYHPHHFARYGGSVRKLATQVFVHVQRAHREAIEIVKTRGANNDAGERRGRTGPRAGRTLEAQAVSQALQLLSLSQFDAARNLLDQALSIDPDSANLQLHRHLVEARAERARGNRAGAAAAYQAVLALNPKNQEARLELMNLTPRQPEQSRGGLFKRLKGARD